MADARPASPLAAAVLRAAAWAGATPRRARLVQIAAAALAFEGTALVLVAPKVVVQHPAFVWVGVAMAALGAFLLLLPTLENVLAKAPSRQPRPAEPKRARPATPTIADRLVARVTLDGRLDKAMPIFGAAVLAFDVLYNRYLTATPAFLSTDFAVIGFGAALIAFPFIPRAFARERNFLLVFFGALALIFGVPLLVLRLGHDASGSVDEYTATLVTPQLSWILNGLGVSNGYYGNDVFYTDLSSGRPASVHIATQCSGLYSMAIFIAAFVSLVVTDYSRLSWRVGGLLCAGVALAYLANLLRMVVIVEAGYNYGSGALLWTHANLGDIIFLAWVAPFMWIAYRILDPGEGNRADAERERFAEGLRSRGVDPATIGDDDWFCTSCFARVEAPGGEGPAVCPECGAPLG